MGFRIERAREKYCIQWPWGANIEAKSLRKRTVKLHLGAMSGAVGGCVWVVSDTQPTMFSYLARVIFASFLVCYQAVVCHSLCIFLIMTLTCSVSSIECLSTVALATKGWLLSGRSERRVPRESAEGEELVDSQWVFMKILRHTCHLGTTQKHKWHMRTVLMDAEANLQWKDDCSNADLSFQRSSWWTIARSTSSLGQHLSFYELFPMQPGLFLVERNIFEAWSWGRPFLVLVQGMVGSQESWAYFRTRDFNCSCLNEEVQSHHTSFRITSMDYIYGIRSRDLIVFMSRFISCRQFLNCTHIHSYTLWGVW